MPLIRRTPKRGFTAPFKVRYQVVNVESLNRFQPNATVGPADLKKAGLITTETHPVKVLGTGTLSKPLTVKAHAFSASAVKRLSEAGASTERLTL